MCVSQKWINYDHLPKQENLVPPQIPGNGQILLIYKQFLTHGKRRRERKRGGKRRTPDKFTS